MRAVLGLVVLTAIVCGTTPAHADKAAVTPALYQGSAALSMCCVVNLDDAPATLTIDIVDVAGAVDVTLTGEVGAGAITCMSDSTPVASYCRVSGSTPKKLRVSYCMADASIDCIATVTAPAK